MSKEIEFYYASTPNGWKVEIALEELGLSYKTITVDIGKGDQFKPEFLAISPNNRIPAIVDPNAAGGPLSIFESGAILIYLAQKTGKFLPDAKEDPAGNADVLQWLMWQMGGVGPMFGQYNHFVNYAPEKIPYAINRYTKEAERLIKVLDTQLGKTQFVAKSGWYDEIAARPAVSKLVTVYKEKLAARKPFTDEEKKVLFGLDKK